jgi:rhamnosyltransferase
MEKPMILPPQTSSTAALIVTYNPDERVLQLIRKLISEEICVFVVDNASDLENSAMHQVSSIADLKIFRFNENCGIGAALNKGLEEIIRSGFEWALQFDQDSIPEYHFAERMFAHWKTNPSKPVLLGCARSSSVDIPVNKYTSTCSVITSGSLLNLDAFSFAGPYRADFFIDGIDFEYALRLRRLGFNTGNTGYAAIDHRLGSFEKEDDKFGWIKPTHHNSLRRYYRARNLVIISRLYFTTFPLFILKYHFFHFISIIVLLIKDNNRIEKLKLIIKGLKDGLFYKK